MPVYLLLGMSVLGVFLFTSAFANYHTAVGNVLKCFKMTIVHRRTKDTHSYCSIFVLSAVLGCGSLCLMQPNGLGNPLGFLPVIEKMQMRVVIQWIGHL